MVVFRVRNRFETSETWHNSQHRLVNLYTILSTPNNINEENGVNYNKQSIV